MGSEPRAYCPAFKLGDLRISTEMASLALERAREHWKDAMLYGLPVTTTLAAIYLQGMLDGADVLERKTQCLSRLSP